MGRWPVSFWGGDADRRIFRRSFGLTGISLRMTQRLYYFPTS
jgi:hypothetical protein